MRPFLFPGEGTRTPRILSTMFVLYKTEIVEQDTLTDVISLLQAKRNSGHQMLNETTPRRLNTTTVSCFFSKELHFPNNGYVKINFLFLNIMSHLHFLINETILYCVVWVKL